MKNILLCFCLGTVSADPFCGGKAEKIAREVRNTVRTINRFWTATQDIDSPSLYVHDDIVVFSPGDRAYGKEAVMRGCRGLHGGGYTGEEPAVRL